MKCLLVRSTLTRVRCLSHVEKRPHSADRSSLRQTVLLWLCLVGLNLTVLRISCVDVGNCPVNVGNCFGSSIANAYILLSTEPQKTILTNQDRLFFTKGLLWRATIGDYGPFMDFGCTKKLFILPSILLFMQSWKHHACNTMQWICTMSMQYYLLQVSGLGSELKPPWSESIWYQGKYRFFTLKVKFPP